MKIHIVSTVNGIKNEGMRNIATHLSNFFANENKVYYSSLKNIYKILVNCVRTDATVIFARCNKRMYKFAHLVRVLCKNLWIVLVQKPQDDYITLNNKHPVDCNYLTIFEKDAEDIMLHPGRKIYSFPVGIDKEKFSPVGPFKSNELKRKYGFDENKLLVVHVGHCSEGRGLEDLTSLAPEKFSVLVVASGMFEDEKTIKTLKHAGVKIISGYLENVNEIYQMADVYVFPTRSGEFVISVPLSVMEALSCGIPVIAYKDFDKLDFLSVTTPSAITLIDDCNQLSEAVELVAVHNEKKNSFLSHAKSWKEVSESILDYIMENIK